MRINKSSFGGTFITIVVLSAGFNWYFKGGWNIPAYLIGILVLAGTTMFTNAENCTGSYSHRMGGYFLGWLAGLYLVWTVFNNLDKNTAQLSDAHLWLSCLMGCSSFVNLWHMLRTGIRRRSEDIA